ncbi:RadC family protein [Sandaracinobacteroides saxicola]|uniref:DNA repair protein RadC n=1 Tax=Sandaracinobacteroides saxicola TaxID=2759707 RepID=A0A7G5IH38_9SPHN|nr:DNA repair protein RadC [Sandaracinobacteroides saxicola]QMW22680.1 DNA repair protein RadC [Sandaracinobacteroides saxicola]
MGGRVGVRAGTDSDEVGQKNGHRERMRQRLLSSDGDAFLDYELLEYVLGLAIPRRDTKPLAKQLLAEFGDLPTLLAAAPAELARVDGLGEGAAAALKFVHACALRSAQRSVLARPVLANAEALLAYLHTRLAHSLTEEFRVLFLNNRNILIRDEAMGDGTVNQAPVYPREIIKRALELGATAVILVHNHPSGDPGPSREDISMTRTIAEAGKPLHIAVHDHLIIARTGHSSLRGMGLI